MRRASEIRAAGTWNAASAIDRVVLDATERHRRRVALRGERGTAFLLDLPHATALKDGDGLVLEDGAIVRVAGKVEPLIEITAASPHELARLAWHIGNRHTEMQVVGDRLPIRRDHVLEEMLRGLGALLTAVEAGDITDAASLERWLAVMIADGSGFCDAVFFAHAHRTVVASDDDALRAVAELAAAFAPSKERHLETTAQGRAFLDSTRAAWPTPALDRLLAIWDGAIALPVAVAVACAGH